MKKEKDNKKPIYKRIWFWIVIIVLVGGASSTIGKGNSNSNNSSTTNSSSSSSNSSNKVSLANFNKINLSSSNITVNFDNDHAVVKSISGLKVNRSKKIALSDFEAISDGQSQEDIKKKFGEPNGYTITDLANYKSEVWDYTSGIKGSVGANFNITFTDGKVSGKSQYDMK